MTLMPVSSMTFFGSRSANGGGSRWIGQRVSASISDASASSGSPSTLYTWPSTPSPTGTVIGDPVLPTGLPRTRPSVGFSAIARTSASPMCCATSQVIVVVSPPSVTSTVSAVLISGSSFGGNSTSTTGPITRTTRPFACPFSFSLRHLGLPIPPPPSAASASAPPTISMISVVISSCRARFAWRVRILMSSSALSVAAFIARRRAAFSDAADSSSAAYTLVTTYCGSRWSRICSGSGSNRYSGCTIVGRPCR